MKKTKKQTLKGFIQSGIIFIGDPVYMSGDLSQPGSETLVDPANPFKNWGAFTHSYGDADANMPFPGASEPDANGRGIVVQTGMQSGQYELTKKYDKEGKLSQLVIRILP